MAKRESTTTFHGFYQGKFKQIIKKVRHGRVLPIDPDVERLQQLFDAVNKNDVAKVEELLELVPRETLSGYQLHPVLKEGKSDDDRFSDKWMREPCMPWTTWNRNMSPYMWLVRAKTYSCTCLHLASALGLSHICRLLLNKGADPNVKDCETNSAIFHAVVSGDVKTVKVIIAGGGLAHNVFNVEDVSPLHVACKQGNVEVVKILLKQPGADVNEASSYIDEIPLFCAAYYGHLQVAQLLVEKGACVNKVLNVGLTAVHEAARNGHSTMIDFLAKKGANLNVLACHQVCTMSRNKELRFPFEYCREHAVGSGTPLNCAVHSSQGGNAVQVLLDHGADVEATADVSPSPLVLAALECKLDIARMLIRAGANVNRPDSEHSMLAPLNATICSYHPGGWKAIEAKNLECVKFLVEEAGASLDLKDPFTQQNCVHFSVSSELLDVFAYLLEKGADPWALDHKLEDAVKYCLRDHYGCCRHWVLKCLQAGLFNWHNMTSCEQDLKPLDFAVRYSDINLIKMFEEACLLHETCLMECHRNCTVNTKALKYFDSAARKVPSLQNITRYVILDAIGQRPGRRAGIESLPIMNKMKRFLMYEDLLPLLSGPHQHRNAEGITINTMCESFHSSTDRELIKERGSPSEIAQLSDSDSESGTLAADSSQSQE